MTAVKKMASWSHIGVLILVIICFCYTAIGTADETSPQRTERFMSRTMRYITPEKAVEYLSKAGLGTASRIANTNSVLVTAEPTLLSKAKIMLELVDSIQPGTVEVLPLFEELADKPLGPLVAEKIKDGTNIGSFDDPPAKDAPSKAIVDTSGNSIIIIAEEKKLEEILLILQDILAEKEGIAAAAAEPNIIKEPNITSLQLEPNIAEPEDFNATAEPVEEEINAVSNDQFFNGLMKSLAEAEKIATELKTTEDKKQADEDYTKQTELKTQAEPRYSEVVNLQMQKSMPETKRFAYTPEKTELADETLELDLPEILNIIDLIDLTGKYLHLDLLYDPIEVKGTVTLRVQKKITVGELYPLLESVLKFRGFMTSRKGNLVTIVPSSRADEIDPILIDGDAKSVQYGDTVVTRVFDLRYIDAQSAENLLNQMKLGANILSIPAASKLFITGYAFRMKRVEEVLAIIDQPGKLKQFRYRQLRFTMARNLVMQVQSLAEQLGTVSVTVSAAPTAAETFESGPTRRTARPTRITPQPTPTAQPTPTTGPSVYLDADERTNRILMIGLGEDLEIIERLVDSLDVAQQDLRTFRLYQIQYVGAEEIVAKLQQLQIISEQRTTAADTTRQMLTRRQSQQQQPMQDQQGITESVEFTEEGLVEKPLVVIVEPTNSILVNATTEQHAQIATIIAFIDAEPEEAATNYIVYPLENQDPVALASVLNQLIQETVYETQGQEDSKIVTTHIKMKTDDNITIIPDPKTYSLIVYANKKNQQWINSIVRQLDEYRPQVLLDVTLVEITNNDSFKFDLDILTSIPDMGYVSGKTGVTSEIFNLLNSPASDRSRFLEGQSLAGSFTGFFGDDKINALLTAIETKKYGRIMARPKLLVNDNEIGSIRAQNEEYVGQTQTNLVPLGDGTTTTQTSVTYTSYTAGVELQIQPHISKGDQLRLQIQLNRTDFAGAAKEINVGGDTFQLPRDKVTSDVETVVTVPNGSTIILGGLEKLKQEKGGSKVPLLGDVPLVGGLFRNISNSDEQSKLYIFVKAHILRPGEQLTGSSDVEVVSKKNRDTFEKYEKEMQEYQDWPGIKSQPLDPLKILEED